jgi:hypothetical protein
MAHAAPTQCLVPFCRHTTKRQFNEWICGAHWKLIDRRIRFVSRRSLKRLQAGDESVRWIAERSWERCKREAIERGLGI